MNAANHPRLHALLLALTAGLGASCHGSTSVHVGPTSPPVYLEVESNDDVFDANDFGWLAPGESLAILGSVRDDAFDPQDGFAFTAHGAITVEFVLDAACSCADLDVWVYDPLTDAFVGVFDAPTDPERGTLTVYDQPFHLVVVSASGDVDYRLDVRAFPAYGASYAPTGSTLTLGNGAPAPVLAREPSEALDRYRASQRRTGPAEFVDVYVIDPDQHVVGTVRIPSPR